MAPPSKRPSHAPSILTPGDPPLYWPERRYQWGTAEAFNKEHSDLLSLRSLLLKEALEEITRTKRQRYEDWRRTQLGGFRLGHAATRGPEAHGLAGDIAEDPGEGGGGELLLGHERAELHGAFIKHIVYFCQTISFWHLPTDC